MEPIVEKKSSKSLLLSTKGLLQPIQNFLHMHHMIKEVGILKTFRLLNKYFQYDDTINEGTVDIRLIYFKPKEHANPISNLIY